ncbi:hypothetical protein G3570_03210 [Balneolaceae bacterium YR4-1]|uniref:Uncharacterized protein n=1 Tax=Halalkalibaculum roseum TaxID=2709311 RepID=A0A6M1T0K4_9BACT|nr:hypothetical protein [Halalkalibaculum roseum]NGP75625.1 hypothetical protein [Halalkalibaculum roseum]
MIIEMLAYGGEIFPIHLDLMFVPSVVIAWETINLLVSIYAIPVGTIGMNIIWSV